MTYASSSGPLNSFPNWNSVVQFTNLAYGEVREKEFDLFAQASVTLLKLSYNTEFMSYVNIIELMANFDDGIQRQLYKDRELEMKGIILEVNFFFNCRLSGIFFGLRAKIKLKN